MVLVIGMARSIVQVFSPSPNVGRFWCLADMVGLFGRGLVVMVRDEKESLNISHGSSQYGHAMPGRQAMERLLSGGSIWYEGDDLDDARALYRKTRVSKY